MLTAAGGNSGSSGGSGAAGRRHGHQSVRHTGSGQTAYLSAAPTTFAGPYPPQAQGHHLPRIPMPNTGQLEMAGMPGPAYNQTPNLQQQQLQPGSLQQVYPQPHLYATSMGPAGTLCVFARTKSISTRTARTVLHHCWLSQASVGLPGRRIGSAYAHRTNGFDTVTPAPWTFVINSIDIDTSKKYG
ncbi:unnamed protein product [Protopolystoma xenopodis]|uniref:Uncharacterized protein n=1 Tax=Protopolystoma xenopodis TaxID=117903 RepID=A0A448WJF2_9PLAT|nr:unnamed protein product [Protopolystoma xenopodis]